MKAEAFFKVVDRLVARLPADVRGGVTLWLCFCWGGRRR